MAKDIFLGLFGVMIGVLLTGHLGAKFDPEHKDDMRFPLHRVRVRFGVVGEAI